MIKSGRIGRIGAIAAGLIILVGAAALYFHLTRAPSPAVRAGGRAGVPVSVAVASREDVPIYLTGIGTVQAFFTIEIHAKVDGELREVLFTEGQQVRKDDVLAKIDPRLYQAALDQAKAKRTQDAAALVAAEKDLARAKTLALRSFDTQQNVDQLQAKADQLKAAILADEALIETAQAQVRASDSKSLATLVLTQPSAVLFTLPAAVLGEVRAAMKRGPVEVTAFDQDNRVALSTGKLLLIDNMIDQATATIRLKAMFANEDEVLWPGAFVNARLLVDTRRNVLAVPAAAIQRGPHGLLAWIVGTNNTAEPRPIEVGPTTGDLTIVTQGVSKGDRVVTAGHYKLQPKTPVVATVAPPLAARAER